MNWQKLYNPLLIWLLRSPWHRLADKHTTVISVAGRKSGKRYTFPVSYVRDGETLLVISRKDRTWWKNLRGGSQVTVLLQGNTWQARGETFTDVEPGARILLKASILVVLCYLAFALLAFARYPLPYSPTGNWLSDLGNVDLNPQGALYYNIGIVATGVLLMAFFLGLSRWKTGNNPRQNFMLLTTQIFGILGALALGMSGLYPMHFLALHSFFSTSLYILLGTAFAFSVAALRYHPTCPRWLLILGALTALVDIIYGVFHTVYMLEWITTALILYYVGLIGAETNRLSSETMDRSTTTAIR